MRLTSGSFNCPSTSLCQASPNCSQARQSTPRGPKSDQSAASIAPVSEAGTTPIR